MPDYCRHPIDYINCLSTAALLNAGSFYWVGIVDLDSTSSGGSIPLALSATAGSTVHGVAYLIDI